MVRNYKKKQNDSGWADSQLKLAVDSVMKGNTIKLSANKYNIPRSTLQRRLKQNSLNSRNSGIGFKRTFSDEEELTLAELIVNMERRLIVLSTKEIRKLAYDFAAKLNISNKFDKKLGLAGTDWLRNFVQRHNLLNRKAESRSATGASRFNKLSVDKFFNLLKELKEQYNFSPANIWNADEICVSLIPETGYKMIARGSEKTASDEGKIITAEFCMSATGIFMPPMLVFPGIKVNAEYLENQPEGSWTMRNNSGRIETDIFILWFRKFIEISKASLNNRVLLLLSTHHTHIKNLEVVDLERENGVTILCFPPNCTHRMQPLNITFMKLLSTYYSWEINQLRIKGVQVQKEDIFSIIGSAWKKSAQIDIAVNAFKTTGIEPLNIHIFDSEFNNVGEKIKLDTETSKDKESFHNIEENVNIFSESMLNNNEGTSSDTDNNTNQQSSAQVLSATNSNCTTHLKNDFEPMVKIPLSHILNAKPLILLLNSIIAEQEKGKNVSETTMNSKKRRQATVMTNQEYVEEFCIQKSKKPKKVIISEISASSNQELHPMNYELKKNRSENILINTEVLQAVDCTSFRNFNGTFPLQSDNDQCEKYILDTVRM